MTTRAVLLLLLALGAQDETGAEALAPLRPIRGPLRVWRQGRKASDPVKDESRVAPQDRLGSAAGEFVSFSTLGDTVVTLKGVKVAADRGLTLEKSGNKLVLTLLEGRVVVESFETELRVETAGGRIEGKGAYFLVEVKENRTRVVAIDGALTFSTPLGPIRLEPGQESTTGPDRKPSEPRNADAATLADVEASGAGSNLLQNPGFEENLKHWRSNATTDPSRAALDDAQARSGRRSARLDIPPRGFEPVKTNWLNFMQMVTLVPGRRYFLRVYLRCETKKGKVFPLLDVREDDEETYWSFEDTAEKKWVMKHVVFTARKAQAQVSIQADFRSEPVEASIWVDDFFLGELPGR